MSEATHRDAPDTARSQRIEILRAFVEGELLLEDGPPMEPDTALLAEGILDSVSVVALLAFLGERFGVDVADGELAMEHLVDLGALADWVGALAEDTGQ